MLSSLEGSKGKYKMDHTTINLYFEVDVPAGAVRSCKNGGKGVISCRVNRPAKVDPEAKYIVSFAFCSPADNFSRPKAKEITSSRMISGQNVCVKLRNKKPLREVVGYAIKKLLREKPQGYNLPRWVHCNIVPGPDGEPRSIKMKPRLTKAHGASV